MFCLLISYPKNVKWKYWLYLVILHVNEREEHKFGTSEKRVFKSLNPKRV
jgi:hypothetical protein